MYSKLRKLLHSEILNRRLSPEEAQKANRHPVYLMLDNIRSLYNVGSIFRTADSALVAGLLLTGYTPYPPRKEIEKTALGAVETVPWQYFKESEKAVEYLKELKVKVFALEITNNSRKYSSVKFDEFPLCIVLGNELTGIDNHLLSKCDDALEIPMYGVKHSLNVSVAAGIAAFEAVSIWRKYNNFQL